MGPKGKYHDLKQVIFLAISDFVMFPNKAYYKSDHNILDKRSGENDLKDFSFTFVELPKFNKNIDDLTDIVEKWCYFFKHAEETSEKDVVKMIDQDHIIERAYEELDRFRWNAQELLTYEQAEKYEGAYLASMEQKFDEGKIAGEKVGIQKGKIEGEKVGIQKGKIEGEKVGIQKGEKQAMLKVAKNLLENGVDIQIITATTSLSEEEINSLSSNV
jgi:predicted transposase/invertase (TIGR01784 family)